MKLKYYLRGLGTGLVVATILLLIAFNARTAEQNLEDNYNHQPVQNEQTTEDELASDEPATDAKDEQDKADNQQETSEEASKIEETTEQVTEKATEKTTEKTTEETTIDQKIVSIRVSSGMASESVARQAADAGLVESAADFNDYLIKNGFSTVIRVGTYEITVGASYLEIANIICGY